ncbi:Nin one binding Zn-ribbon like-domain-containing protein [Elsinoe ampelina]|uniref:20S-pre-rRNA D-site endonuclease NOB1 n=1 Tax=Elsinoe ampelina TaxID=302913 RepID=A0A6A6G4M1_9PEZI|nr:Nin one binding Zn-ribbon like-domain-containing protein [Elsinoe ampelina]
MATEKPIHTIILDTGPIIRNHPTVSSLLAQSEEIVTVPAIISEIKDAVTRSRVETTLIPFLKLRSPTEDSLKFVTEFARKTGDAAVLSRVDLQIAALAYEVECERNGGDWRLRRVPGQKRVNGSPPKKDDESTLLDAAGMAESAEPAVEVEKSTTTDGVTDATMTTASDPTEASNVPISVSTETATDTPALPVDTEPSAPEVAPEADDSPSSSDGEWITPSNLTRKRALLPSTTTTPPPSLMQAATLTTDNALQNLLLQINLNLITPSLSRITQLRSTLLRCHACFLLHRVPDVQFCQRCGKPTLTRVTVTTSSSGEVKVHLKKNMQWSHRGERYSIPKPVHGSANGRIKGGGKGGWGNGLVLAEDQKEFARNEERRRREEKRGKGIGGLDEDYLPGILTGRREGRQGGRVKVGAGRDVNARKR